MGDAGSPYARFRRALDTGDVTIVRAAALELPRVGLADALRVCYLMRHDPDLYERAVVRWVGRFCLEGRADLDAVREAIEALGALPHFPRQSADRLARLCRDHGVPMR